MDLQLTGRRAVVTGGAGGLGLPIAHALAAEGVDLVLAGRTSHTLQTAADEVATRSGRQAYAVVCDVRHDESVQTLSTRTADLLGGIDILVNCAADQAIGRDMPDLAGTTDEIFLADLDTKLGGYLRTCRAVAPYLVAQGWGRIINLGGTGARETRSIARTVRNAGIVGLTANLAEQLGPDGVCVTAVHPGPTDTGSGVAASEHNRLGRAVTAAEVADVVAFLASPRSAAVNGDGVTVDGGTRGVVHY